LTSLREIIDILLNEIKTILKEYLHESETEIKKRFKKFLISSITISILVSLIISFLGSASLFILIGSLKYLMTSMPAWKAWYIIGITSGIIGAIILITLYLIIRKQYGSSKSAPPTKTEK
jgi:hypothetical protein